MLVAYSNKLRRYSLGIINLRCPLNIKTYNSSIRVGTAQSVEELATGWTTEGTDFKSRSGQKFSLLHVVRTGSAVHPTSYPNGTETSFPGGKATGT
jgi:hypothetical protein